MMIFAVSNKQSKSNKMKYITVLESGGGEAPNIGTLVVNPQIDESFRDAIESHFDATLVSFSFVDGFVNKLSDCINQSPIDVVVYLDDLSSHTVELSETWIYGK